VRPHPVEYRGGGTGKGGGGGSKKEGGHYRPIEVPSRSIEKTTGSATRGTVVKGGGIKK